MHSACAGRRQPKGDVLSVVLCLFALARFTDVVAAPTLSDGRVSPRNGNLATPFTFEVAYTDPSGGLPAQVLRVLGGTNSALMSAVDPTDVDTRDGKRYRWQGTLPRGRHAFSFSAGSAGGDTNRHWGPIVSDQSLTFRHRYFYLRDQYAGAGALKPLGDVTGDGVPDIAFQEWQRTTILKGPLYSQDEAQYLSHPDGMPHMIVSVGDATGDGIGDYFLQLSDQWGGYADLRLYAGSTSGVPTLAQSSLSTPPPVERLDPSCVPQRRDMNGDGVLDWVLGPEPSAGDFPPTREFNMAIRFGPGFTNGLDIGPTDWWDHYFSTTYVVTDEDGDGRQDVLMQVGVTMAESGGLRSWTNTGFIGMYRGPSFSAAEVFTNTPAIWADWVNLGPVHGGPVDVITGHLLSATNQARWFHATNVFASQPLPYERLLPAGDVNADGLPDVAACVSNRITFLGTDHTGGFTNLAEVTNFCPATSGAWLLGDVDGNGLADFLLTSPYYARGGFGPHAPPPYANQLGEVLLPFFPYPLGPADLPATYAGRASWFQFAIELGGNVSVDGLMPNAAIAIIVGRPDADGRAPVTLPASSLSFPDTLWLRSNSTPNLWVRLQHHDLDGGGWLYVSGPRAGEMELEGELRVGLWSGPPGQPAQTLLPGMEDVVHVRFRALERFDFTTGRVVIEGRTRLPTLWWKFFSAMFGGGLPPNLRATLPNLPMRLTFEVNVDYIPPSERSALRAVPDNLVFPSVPAGGVSAPHALQLCNLGSQPVRVTSITAPAAPFQFTNAPVLPAVIPPQGVLSLGAVFAPGQADRFEQWLTVASDDPEQPQQRLRLFGFGLPAGETDADNDGIPDAFELAHGVPASTNVYWGLVVGEDDSWLDFDQDGADNWSEYMAGTDPTTDRSLFRTFLRGTVANPFILRWPSASGRTYTVHETTNLSCGFTVLSGPLAATPPTNSYDLPMSGGSAARFYRVKVQP